MKKDITNCGEPKVVDSGIMGFSDCLDLQMSLVDKRIDNEIDNTVLIVEHHPVITLGARASENILLVSEDELKAGGIDIVQVRRGGGTTAHNPGQLVFYPIIKLSTIHLGIAEYIRTLESIGIELLKGLSIQAERKKGAPGLWIGKKKIASIGVKVKKWVTYHGMAINICNDLSIFDNIVPCGLEGVEMTSALKEGINIIRMEDIKKKLAEICKRRLSGGKDKP